MSAPIDLREYQKKAITRWEQNGYIGLFEMATGTGKTITALSAAKKLLESDGSLCLLILIPTLDLASQWENETEKFLFKNIIVANSKNKNWYKEVVGAINHKPSTYNYCIIATYATFLTSRFQSIIQKLPETTMLIADEAHNFGTKKHSVKYPNHIQRRLALSATPDRHFDDVGTKDILKYFHAEETPTFKFDMAEAIKSGFLCEYYYYPVIVSLTENELKEYKDISKKLLQYFNSKTGRFKEDSIVKMLLLKRKRIVHNATKKFSAFRKILTDIASKTHKVQYLLVYVPEGNDKKIEKEDQNLINAYSEIIAKEFKLTQHQFIGLTKNRKKILDEFSKGKIAVLTAMKCLDEGIDIKRAETAIFCSSTGNPRQFIQRRGRILRTHPDKKFAVIYDLVVVPMLTNQYFEDSLQMERNILQGELRRVHEFAELSLNHYQALQTLEETAMKFDVDIFQKNYFNIL
jgi:superfamily II DNA or RNA helicase